MKKQILLICLITIPSLLLAQEGYSVRIDEVYQDKVDPSNVVIKYELLSSDRDALYTVDLEILYPGGERKKLTSFEESSDIGPNQRPGPNKTIIWQAAVEETDFERSVNFIVGAVQTYSPIKFQSPSPNEVKRYKIGKEYPITWTGGIENEKVVIDLVDNKGGVIRIGEDYSNDKKFVWKVEKKHLGNYSMTITHRDRETKVNQVKIVRKFPIFLRVMIGVAVLGGGAFLYDQAIAPDELPNPQFPQ